MPTTIDSAGITFNDTTSFTSATLVADSVGATQITNGSVTASKLGTNEQKQICKAWVNFDGTTSPGTIRSSYNVSSVTKNGTGDYTVNFANALADANYAFVGIQTLSGVTTANQARTMTPITLSTSSVRCINTGAGVGEDGIIQSAIIFGN
jgi:hypothetical protein